MKIGYQLTMLIALCLNIIIGSGKLYSAQEAKETILSSGKLEFVIKDGYEISIREAGITLLDAAPLSLIDYRYQGVLRSLKPVVKSLDKKAKPGGKSWELVLGASESPLELLVTVTFPSEFSNVIILSTSMHNRGTADIVPEKNIFANFKLRQKEFSGDDHPSFWAYLGYSSPYRTDWAMPVSNGFYRENFMGMNSPDYGGGMPILDVWTKKRGIAVASLSLKPELIALPINVSENEISLQVKDSVKSVLRANQTLPLPELAVIIHKGDYFNALNTWSALLQKRGMKFSKSPHSALEPEWCAWGYERGFNKGQIISTLKKVKELGFTWVTLDDGWQNADGDWEISKEKYPGGEKEFTALVDSIHKMGFKVRLWWVPFETHDSAYNRINYPDRMAEWGMNFQSALSRNKPEWFLLDKDQKRVQVSWWNSYFLCPAVKEMRDHFRKFVKRAIVDWKIDGFKVDGQNMNAVPPCFNPKHNHKTPEEACYAVPEFFKDIMTESKKWDPDIVIQLCPCGDNFSIYNLPYTNQTVGSDPESSFQVRSKGKAFKAIYGNTTAYSGDHVELTARKWNPATQKSDVVRVEDFASTIAVGGVPSTKFTLQGIAQKDSSFMLTPEKEEYWKKWLGIYHQARLSEGEYLNLYDIAFDMPEGHAVRRAGVMYYSFFSARKFSGPIELRGLKPGSYRLTDMISGKIIGTINGKNSSINITFDSSIIIKAEKIK